MKNYYDRKRLNTFLNSARQQFLPLLASFLALFSFASDMYGQANERDYIRMGNAAFKTGQYQRAETFYTKSIDKNPTLEGYYNLANALMGQGKDSTAFEMFKKAVAEPSSNVLKRAHAYHNMGNLMYINGLRAMKMGQKEALQSFQNSVELYKSSLRLNPEDNETRYNLAMAQYMLKKSQQGGGGENNNQNNQDDKDDKQKQQQQQQNQQDKDKQQEQQKKKQQEQKKDQIDDQTADQLLNSAQQDEKNVQQKIQKQPNSRRSLEKDW